MSKIIPILPCSDIKKQAEFYTSLGFIVKGIYTSPNAYLAVEYGDIELHFWKSKKNVPTKNASMCFIKTEDTDGLNRLFTDNIKKFYGKTPRTGFPRISKVCDLKDDRRFTLTDVGGNTFYIGETSDNSFFRTIENVDFQKDFSILYDLQYSKEDSKVAANMLPRLLAAMNELCDLDKAKLLLAAYDIWRGNEQAFDDSDLLSLIEKYNDDEWEQIKIKYLQGKNE